MVIQGLINKSFNPFKYDVHLSNIWKLRSYLTENSLSIIKNNQLMLFLEIIAAYYDKQ
jgi:hypothetical protein